MPLQATDKHNEITGFLEIMRLEYVIEYAYILDSLMEELKINCQQHCSSETTMWSCHLQALIFPAIQEGGLEAEENKEAE